MLTSIIAIIILISIASCITEKFKFKQENSILITFLSIALFLYISGLFNLMKYATYLIYIVSICSIIYIIYCLIKKKIKIQEIITPGVLIYIFTIFISTFIVLGTNYIEWDEFSHWGPNLKAMVQYDLLWSNNIYDGVHVVYPPLAGIVEYFFCKINGGFAEYVSYIGINTFMITLLLPICKNEKYNFKALIKLILFWIFIYCSIILCNFKLASIYIDLLLGILFAISMFLAYRMDGKEDKITLFLILICMPLLKDTGLLFLGIVLMQLFFNKVILKIIENRKITKENFKKFGIIVAILVLSLGIYTTWKLYCSSNNRYLDDRHDKNSISEIDIKQYIKAILLLDTQDTKYIDISRAFYNALNSTTIIGNSNTKITAIKFVIILDIIGILLYLINKKDKEKKEILTLLLSFNIGFVLYCLLLLATFMFAFTEQEGRTLASYSRYMTTYFISWIIAIIGIIINNNYKNQLILLILAIMLCIYPTNTINLIDITSRKGAIMISNEITLKSNIIKENVTSDKKVYLIYQNIGGGIQYHMLRYSISPIVTNLMYEWSLGPAYNEEDIWSYNITKEQFEKKLIEENFDYVFIAQIDEQFIQIYGELIEGNYNLENYKELTNKLLKVNKINENKITLSQ